MDDFFFFFFQFHTESHSGVFSEINKASQVRSLIIIPWVTDQMVSGLTPGHCNLRV